MCSIRVGRIGRGAVGDEAREEGRSHPTDGHRRQWRVCGSSAAYASPSCKCMHACNRSISAAMYSTQQKQNTGGDSEVQQGL